MAADVHDRLNVDEFEMTQEFMYFMLGVRRSSVTEVALKASRADALFSIEEGILRFGMARQEQFTCECLKISKEKFDDLFKKTGRCPHPLKTKPSRRALNLSRLG